MDNPFFSVIIPTYNQADYLKEALDSVCSQTFKSFEVIVIDNSSDNKSKKLIANYKKKIVYKKIINKGVIAKSRNLGIKLSQGKWIAFLDSDDYWQKNKLEKVYNQIQKRNFDVICNNEWLIYSENKKQSKIWSYGPVQKNYYETLLKYGNRNSTSASLIKSSFLKRNKILFNENKKFVTCEDYCFFLDAAFKLGKFFYLQEPLGYHRFHDLSSSNNKKKHEKAEREVIKYHVNKIQNFTKNKKKLISNIKNYMKIKSLIFKLVSPYRKFKYLLQFFLLFTNYPILTIKVFNFTFIKLLKQMTIGMLYRFQKNIK